MIATIFTHPITLRFTDQLWFLMPLCVAVAVVYKTIRTQNIARLALEIVVLVGYMIAGLVALGAGLWALQRYWP